MRIGISGYVGNKLTGIGRVLKNILIELAIQNPNNIYVLFSNYDFEDFTTFSWPSNVQVVKIKVSKSSTLGNIIWHQFMFQINLLKYKCELSMIPNFSLLLWKVVPTIVIIHDLIEYNVPEKFSKLRMKYRFFIVPRMAHKSDFIITVSDSSKLDIIKYCKVNESKVETIPNAADSKVFRNHELIDVTSTLNKYNLLPFSYLLFVGTIDYPGKNIKKLLEVYFELCEKKQLDYKLVIIGKDGHNSDVIYKFVNNSKHKNNVIFMGYVNDNDLPYFYSGAKLTINLSLYEGFGLPVLEAMSCGCPVVIPSTSCFPEIVPGIDVCVHPNDSNAIGDKIMQLLENEELYTKIKSQCYNRSQHYSWSRSANEYQNIFNKINNHISK